MMAHSQGRMGKGWQRLRSLEWGNIGPGTKVKRLYLGRNGGVYGSPPKVPGIEILSLGMARVACYENFVVEM